MDARIGGTSSVVKYLMMESGKRKMHRAFYRFEKRWVHQLCLNLKLTLFLSKNSDIWFNRAPNWNQLNRKFLIIERQAHLREGNLDQKMFKTACYLVLMTWVAKYTRSLECSLTITRPPANSGYLMHKKAGYRVHDYQIQTFTMHCAGVKSFIH